jgi:hypothetical protein
MDGVLDRAELRNSLLGAFAREPELFAEVEKLFLSKNAPHEGRMAFDYLFVVCDDPTIGAGRPVIGFRLRDADERRVALGAFDRQKAGVAESGHVGHGFFSWLTSMTAKLAARN